MEAIPCGGASFARCDRPCGEGWRPPCLSGRVVEPRGPDHDQTVAECFLSAGRKRSLEIGRGGNRSTSISEMHSRLADSMPVDRFRRGPAETDRRRTFFHVAQFTSFFLQGAECAPTDDVTSKQRSHCGVCLSLAAAKTVEAETWGNGADTAADRGSWKRTTRWDDPSTLRPVARAHGPNEERGAGRRTAHERATSKCDCGQA